MSGTTGRFFEGGHPLDVGALLRRNVVFEIEDVGDDQDKAFLIGAVLIQLVEHLRVWKARGEIAPGLRHITVVEEAHRLLRNVAGRACGRTRSSCSPRCWPRSVPTARGWSSSSRSRAR